MTIRHTKVGFTHVIGHVRNLGDVLFEMALVIIFSDKKDIDNRIQC